MLISSSIPNLINGISQQPATLRLASQAEEQVNFLSSVADGLTNRPPTRHVKKLDDAAWSDAFLHTINRDTSERYIVVIRNERVRVFEAETGVERVVNAPGGWTYLNGGGQQDYRAVTVADYTFILNRKKEVTASSELSPARPNKALVTIRASNYGKTYEIYIDGVLRASHETPDGSDKDHTELIDTGHIAEQLLVALNASGLSGFIFSRSGDNIVISRSDDTLFSVRVEDGSGGVNAKAIQYSVQRFSDLPSKAPEGFSVEVAGDQSSSFDNYHVTYMLPEGLPDGTGVWKETVKGGEEFKLSAGTMPHTLVREANGEFTFKVAEWDERKVGDLEKIPHPSFVGRTVSDVFFFQNRLGLVSDENVVLSQDGAFFDFYRATATTVLDTDPVDLAVTSNKVSLINHAVPFNRTLLLFSDQSQFILSGGDIFSAQSASVSQATSFESYPGVRPVGVGQYVYFPVPRGSNAGIREYFVQEGGEQNDAHDITSHAPRYLPKEVSHMAASSSEDTLLVLSDTTPNTLWVYRFFFNQEGKLQSAWSNWEFSPSDTLKSAEFIESSVYLVVTRADGTYLENISLESGRVDDGSSFHFRMDRGVTSVNIPSAFDGAETVFTLPYASDEALHVAVLGGDDVYPEGTAVPFSRPSATEVRLVGDWTDRRLIFGVKYKSTYVFSTFYLRSQEPGGGMSANAAGRVQLRYLAVDYADAGYFEMVSKPRGRNASRKIFSGRILGVSGGSTGEFNLSTGRFRIPVMCRNMDAYLAIETDSFFPASFTAAEWEATYTNRARRG